MQTGDTEMWPPFRVSMVNAQDSCLRCTARESGSPRRALARGVVYRFTETVVGGLVNESTCQQAVHVAVHGLTLWSLGAPDGK